MTVGHIQPISDCAATLGAHGERVTQAADLVPALRRAMAALPAMLDVVTRDAVSSDASKGLAVVPDYQALADWDTIEQRRHGAA